MDISAFYPINTKIRVNLLIDAIQSQTEYINLNNLETKIILNIRSLRIQIYFKERFKILKDNYSLFPTPPKRITPVVFITKSKANKEFTRAKPKSKKKKALKRVIHFKTFNANNKQTAYSAPSKFKGVRRKTANCNFGKIIYTNHPKS